MPKIKFKKRADGRYLKNIQVGYLPNGKPDRRSVYGRTAQELEENIAAFWDERKKAEAQPEEVRVTVKECAESWLELYIKGAGDLRDNTVKMYDSCIRNRFETINDLSIQEFCIDDYMKIRNSIKDRQRALEIFDLTLRQILDYAVTKGYIEKNFLDDEHNKRSDRRKRKKLKKEQATEDEKRSLSDEEIKEIFALKLPEKTRLYIAVLYYVGSRRGETWALKKSDLDFDAMMLNINKTALSGTPYREGPPKSKVHNVPMAPELAALFQEYFKVHTAEYIFADEGEDFPPPYHRIDALWAEFIRIYNESKGGTADKRKIADDITPHIFRHTFATSLYYAGVDFMTALEWLGDSDLNMLLKVYTHPDDVEAKKEVAEKLCAHMQKKLM